MKINSQGQFLPVAGFTVISPVDFHTTQDWQDVHRRLQSIPHLTEYYGLLPWESYHMTLFGVGNANLLQQTPLETFQKLAAAINGQSWQVSAEVYES